MDAIDRGLLERLTKGDTDAFKRIFQCTYVSLVQHAAFYVMDIYVAEDIVQDTFTNVWGNRHKIGSITNFEGYLLRSVRNSCLNHIKHVKVNNSYRRSHMLREVEEVETDPEIYYKAIYELIGRMPDKRREVFELSVFRSKTYAEISESVGISINTVKEHIKAAYAYLRKHSIDIPYP